MTATLTPQTTPITWTGDPHDRTTLSRLLRPLGITVHPTTDLDDTLTLRTPYGLHWIHRGDQITRTTRWYKITRTTHPTTP